MARTKKTGIQKAIDFAGGIRPLERESGINRNVICRMRDSGVVLPKHCINLHERYGISLHELNPEQYPKSIAA